jgi:hypothetical protein
VRLIFLQVSVEICLFIWVIKMQVQIKLDIDTGSGNYATAGSAGILPSTFKPLLDIAFSNQVVDDFHRLDANNMGSQIDRAIDSLQRDRRSYLALTEAQIALRPQVEAYLIGWRDLCRKHPNCFISIVP